MKSTLLALALLVATSRARGLVSCAPTDCVPGCDSSCSFQNCTLTRTMSLAINTLPFVYETPADACADSLNGVTMALMPQIYGDIEVKSLPLQTIHSYEVCQTFTKAGPACPPPPPVSRPGG